MKVVRTVRALRAARADLGALGLVPTMGFLHAGHLSLVERARSECGACAVSIFVNPTQFAPNEDLARYPRALERDLALLEQAGTALAFLPEVTEIYPAGFSSRVEVGAIAEPLEGAIRPGHFSGVATVVAKLLNMAQPTRAYFGQKDAQQCAVVRRMARDLDLPVEIVVAPTVRETDGLALSSRNSYLTSDQRRDAPILFRALSEARLEYEQGQRSADALRRVMRTTLDAVRNVSVDYVSVANRETLIELDRVEAGALLSLAVRFGATRLIDNVLLDPDDVVAGEPLRNARGMPA